MKNKIITEIDAIKHSNNKLFGFLRHIFSDKTGIVNGLLERNELRPFGFRMYQTLSAQSVILFNNEREVSSGGLGINKSNEMALIASFYEALERYCMSCTDHEKLIYQKFNDIQKKFRLDNFKPYTNNQYRKNKCFKNPLIKPINWVKINQYKNRTNHKFWPASLVYLPFKSDDLIGETSSTGVAASTSLDKAIFSGLLELIERDAFMTNFSLPITRTEIDCSSFDKTLNGALLSTILRKKFNIKIYKLYSNLDIPVYMAFIWKKNNGRFHFGIGGSASLNSDLAIEKTLKECLFSFYYSKNILDLRKSNKKQIKTLYEHFLYYQNEKEFGKLIKRDKTKINYAKHVVTKKNLLNSLRSCGFKIFYFDLTTPDVVEFCKVVKVIVPGLIDLNKSYLLPRLGEKRYKFLWQKLKIKGNFKLSTLPHPFP